MNELEFPGPDRSRAGGTWRAPLRAVAHVALAAALAQPSCLLNKRIVPDDAEITPLTPAVIVEDPTMTNPLPGTLKVIRAGEAVTFQVKVIRGDEQPLQAVYFIDRARPCDGPETCGEQQVPLVVTAPEAGLERTVPPFTRRFREPGHCYRVDLYISPAFRAVSDPRVEHEPQRTGDVAHARWLVVTRNQDDTLPPISICEGEPTATP